MEIEDVMPGAGTAGDDLGVFEPPNVASGGRNEILGTGSDVEKPGSEGALAAAASGNLRLEGGGEKNEGSGVLVRGVMEAVSVLEKVSVGGTSTSFQDDTKEAEGEREGEEGTDSAMKTVAAADVSEGAVVLGETESLRAVKRLDTNGSENVNPNGKEAEEPLLGSTQRTDSLKSRENAMKSPENQKDADRYRITSSIAEVVAAGVAAGVAEGIAESIAETIAKETASASGQGSTEGRALDSGRFERMAIAKAVAEVIAESVAQEVAQGMADGLAEAAATGEARNGAELKKLDSIQGLTDANKDAVLCDCELVAVVRIVGEKSPNRGLRYLMCPRQDPSFFKRKGKRKDSDTIGKCKFFRWLDTPRHTSKEDKKNQEKEKTQVEEPNVSLPTRSSAKESPTLSSGERGEVSPPEAPTADDIFDLKTKSARKQRKKGLAEEDTGDLDRPASAGTLTRSALRRGASEPSLDTSAVSTPVSLLGKRTIDWTDSYIGPESQVVEKTQGVSFRKRRSVRGESGPSSRYSLGGSGRGAGVGSSEKKPLHYFRRSTGQVGAPDGDPINLDSPHPSTDVESPGDNRFKSYYKKGRAGRSLEPASEKLQLGKPRGNRVADDVSLVEAEKKTKPQTRRQQRKLPLSEVYGAMEPSLSAKPTNIPTSPPLGTDHSLSLEKNTPSAPEAGLPSSPPKKRKLSWVLSEDSTLQETGTTKRASASKGNSINFERQIVEAPLLASAFPTVRYEAKLPAEDYHDPDDPWSLEIPWAKQEHQEKEKDEREGEAMEGEAEAHAEERSEAAAVEEELPEPDLTGFANSGAIREPVFSDNTLIAAGGQESGISGSLPDQKMTDGQVGVNGPEENHVDREHEVSTMPKGATSISASEAELLNPSVHSRSYIGDEIKPESTYFDSQRSAELPLEKGSLLSTSDVSGQSVREDHVVRGANDSEAPAVLQDQQMSALPDEHPADDKAQTSVEAGEHASVMSKSASMKAGETTAETARERSEQPGALNDAGLTNEEELVLSGDGHGVHDLQDNVEGTTDEPIEEPAISGSNLMAAGGVDHEPEGDLSLDQDTVLKSPRETDNAGAASESAGFVNSVWRSASGKKTRSIGSIGAPAVTSKRSRSAVPSHKGGPKGGPRRPPEVQWVDVPLDWRNEKSTGRAPLLPNFSEKGLNGSDTTQSEMRLLQSADSAQGTRPRGRRGEVDDSSIITEEKEKGHEDSTEHDARVTRERDSTLGNAALDFVASLPADEQGLEGGPADEQAGEDNAALRKKRGRPRKDGKKAGEFQYFVADGHEIDAAGGANQAPEPELAEGAGKAEGEPSSLVLCSTIIEGNTTTEVREEDRVAQLERSASNTERENGKPEGVSSEPDECGISLDGSNVPSATPEGLQLELEAPYCFCKLVPRQAVLRTVVRIGDPNQGLRYWSCSNYRKIFTKKKKPTLDVTEERCNYFRWLDTPRVTAKDKREARKERYRQVELQRLL